MTITLCGVYYFILGLRNSYYLNVGTIALN